jgi:hypothetical protein
VTNSTLQSPDGTPEIFLEFTGTFSAADHPEVVLMSGGEPLLHAGLVRDLAERARRVGTCSYVLTGGYFVRRGDPTPAVAAALDAVDHVAVSLDPFHEREVPRDAVFRLLGELLRRGKDVSVQITAPPGDPYPARVTSELDRLFQGRVPALVVPLRRVGRAAATGLPVAPDTLAETGMDATAPAPCVMAAWPLVTCTGDVTACCNHHVVARPGRSHLALGHARDGWPAVRQRSLRSAPLRAIRLYGPQHVMAQQGGVPSSDGCRTCHALPRLPEFERRAEELMSSPVSEAMEGLLFGGPTCG